MFQIRPDEPEYALLRDIAAPQTNRYGKPLELVAPDDPLAGQSLHINNDNTVGRNPNRYKQHGFYFNADNCISCHACEAACSEKNDLPAHISFRSVGYVEGGSYPDYRRLNISMACNHCDNPVCLKGCPTRAYTKFAEYGAVLQDPDICFGCGYCTWVCPYNAPQLDPVKGQVSKCNMCVDRLEAGLKPACAAACLAGALDFGIVETLPENRHQLATQIPAFPTPDITHPNIRFQQNKALPREMIRPDAMPLRYVREESGAGGIFVPQVRESGKGPQWNLRKLRSREDPLVLFTLITQAAVGAFLLLFLSPLAGLEIFSSAAHPWLRGGLLLGMLVLQSFALFISTMHLGKPHRFYRAFNNLRYSPVSREVASLALFYNFMGAYTVLELFPGLLTWLLPGEFVLTLAQLCGWAAVISGLLTLYAMHGIYRIKARPFWNHWQVLTAFYGSMLSLGALTVGMVYAFTLAVQGEAWQVILYLTAWPLLGGLLLESIGLLFHARAMKAQSGEGAAAHYKQTVEFGKSYYARNAGLAFGITFNVLLLFAPASLWTLAAWGVIAVLLILTAVLGRALFYVLVIPTTMPGAFFWRNKGFEEHARETGLAEMPQVGVLPDSH